MHRHTSRLDTNIITFYSADDTERTTALHLAAEEGHLDCVMLLLKHEAKLNSEKKNGETPLLLAVKRGTVTYNVM
jgi:ankyrin repeat protein